MDLISAAIDSVRIGRASGRRITESGAWGVRFPPIAVLGFHAMLKGTGWLITTDADPVAVRRGDVVFTAAGTEHGISHVPCRLDELPEMELGDIPPAPGPADFEFLCGTYRLDNHHTPPLLRRLPGVVALTPDYDRHPQLRAVIEMLAADYEDPRPGTDASRAALIDLMIVHILRQLHEREPADGWPLTTEPGIAGVLREIHERPDRQWTVRQLSGVAGMSRTAFTQRFTSAVGRSPMAYLIDWRLSSGARLLRQTTDPLATVARRVGYATEFSFGAAFRRRYGVSPGRFRTEVRG